MGASWGVTLHKHTNQRMSIVYAWNMQHVTSWTTWFIQRAFLLTHSILYTLNRFFVLPWNNMGWWQSISGNNMRRVYSFILNDSLSPAIRSRLQRFRARYHKSRLLPKTRPSWSLQWERANQGQVVWCSFPVVSTGFRVWEKMRKVVGYLVPLVFIRLWMVCSLCACIYNIHSRYSQPCQNDGPPCCPFSPLPSLPLVKPSLLLRPYYSLPCPPDPR